MNKAAKIKHIAICMLIMGGVILLIDKDAEADFTFGTPMSLGPTVNAQADNGNPHISPDGLALYFSSGRSGGSGGHDLYVSRRETPDAEWGTPVNLGPTVNSSADDWGPSLSPNGLELYFTSKRSGGHGGFSDIWLTTRATQEDDWGSPINLGPNINTSDFDGHPSISSDGLELYFCTSTTNERPGSGDSDIWVTSRLSLSDPWGPPVNLGSVVNSPYYDGEPDISADGLCLVLGSDRPGGSGGWDIWVTTRKKKEDPWGTPVNLGPEINSSNNETMADISYDGSMLYFASDQSGEYGVFDIWEVPIIPIVDFNGDGIVDSADMCIMVDHWGENYSSCDIGPMPWGDGVVDVEDLKMLAQHLFEEVDDPTLIAHWTLNESQGTIAYDDAADCNGTLIGGPVWQPDGGMVAGALQFDGIDDHVVTDSVLNPADGPFSVFAWIQGGAPGQVVISQQSMANWLTYDAEGNLMTELKCTGRTAGYLFSETFITDGQWHRIGLVWDGSQRMLFVDGISVAKDTQNGLEGSEMGLYLGTGKGMEPGTFFSGLIDDVRIYNRAVRP